MQTTASTLFSSATFYIMRRMTQFSSSAMPTELRGSIVTEDPRETDDDSLWAYVHDKRGTFRGLKEWRNLFSAVGFTLVHEIELDGEPYSRHFFLLAPNK